MDRLTPALAGICRAHPITEKWLLAPSRRTGFQWLDRLAATGAHPVNMRVQTLKFMAFNLAAPDLVGLGLGFLSRNAGTFFAGLLFSRLRGKGSGYLLSQPPGEGLFSTVFEALTDLRLAGLRPDDLYPRHFEDPGKTVDLRLLLEEYLNELKRRSLTDYAGVLELAARRLREDSSVLPVDLLVILPGSPRFSSLEERLLEQLPPGCLVRPEQESQARRSGFDSSRLAAALAPANGLEAEIFRAVGESNEVRETLRRVLSSGLPLDRVEVLHTDSSAYVPLFYELALSLPSEAREAEGELPLTFAEGIPVRLTRPGRALAAWLDWQARGYPQSALAGMLQDGLLELEESGASGAELAAILRLAPIGLGRERYLPGLRSWIEALKNRGKQRSRVDESGEPLESGDLESQCEKARWLEDFVKRLLDATPETGPTRPELLERADAFLNQFARSANKQDNYAREALCKRIAELREWADADSGLDLRAFLAGMLDMLTVQGENPAPGRLHVANIRSGGHSGRPVTFILGLDDGRFPGGALQDPVLLDAERTRLSKGLPTAASHQEQTLEDFTSLLEGLTGRVCLGFSSRNLEDGREMFPSPVLLHVHRLLSGDPAVDQSRMLESLPPAASFAPAAQRACLDSAEWWLRSLCASAAPSLARGQAETAFPHLKRGRIAVEARCSGHLTGYDGYCPEAGRDLDPVAPEGRPMSASAFERLGRCPLAFFFRYGLELKPPEDYEADPALWLDSLQAGSLLHEVFYSFVKSVTGQGAKPEDTPEQRARLAAVLDETVGRYRSQYPAASDGAFQRRRRELERTAAVFLAEEAEHCRQSTPLHLEWAIGMGDETGVDGVLRPERLRLPDGRGLRLRGRIDRVDREADGAFVIWDYKTGGTGRYSLSDPFCQGRVVQPALYLELASGALCALHGVGAQAAAFGFFFPGPRGRGQRLRWQRENLGQWTEVLSDLCDILASGAFIATDADSASDTPPDCRNCEYQSACGDLHETVAASSDKLRNLENTILEPFRRLRPREAE